jgi:hypothetical protein
LGPRARTVVDEVGGGRVRHDRAGEAGSNVQEYSFILLRTIGIDLMHKQQQAYMTAKVIEELRREQLNKRTALYET